MYKGKAAVAIVGLVALGAALSAPAMAQDSAFYVGGQIGSADYKAARDSERSWGAIIGYDFTPNYGLEVSYVDMGKITNNFPGFFSETLSGTAYDLAVVAAFDVTDRFSMYGRLGAYRAEMSATLDIVNGESFAERSRNTGVTYGIGARFNFGNHLAVRGAYQRYHDAGDIMDVDTLTVALLFRF